MPPAFKFCPRCGLSLSTRDDGGLPRLACSDEACGFIHYENPTPVVAAIVELPDGVVLARGRGWPEKVFGLPTGFLEKGEDPASAVVREVKEELSLDATVTKLVGLYSFEAQNQLIIAYHLTANGAITLNDELEQYKIIPVEKLRGWPFATGLAVTGWLESKNRPHRLTADLR
ncbi:MAG: NUDIX domain-containing protein [Polyangiaceae bacterium]